MPYSFIVLALVMSVVAALFIVLPARRSAHENGQSWRLAAGIFAVIIIAGSAAFYSSTSSWNWSENGVHESPLAQQLYELQRAVHENDGDAAAWARLGRFYLQFETQIPAAIDALEKSVARSRGRDIETNLNLVEALAIRGTPEDVSRSAQIISASLQIDPRHRKALWYGGEVAASLGQWDTAIARWQVMLDDSQSAGTPEAARVTGLLEDRIATAKEQLAAAQGEGPAGGRSDAHSDGAGAGSSAGPEAVRVRVSLNGELAQTPGLTPATRVFVFVRAAGQGGPPLAAHRATAGQLPLDIVLSDRDAMMPGRTISAFDDVEIVARVSLSGTPTVAPGDLFGAATLGGNEAREVDIVIDQVASGR